MKGLGLELERVGRQEDHLARLEGDAQEILGHYDGRIAVAEKQGFTRLVEQLREQRAHRAALFERTLAQAHVRLGEAKAVLAAREAIVDAAQQETAAEAEATAKRLARVAFVAHGGDPEQFEAEWLTAWREIQREMRAQEASALPVRL